MARAGHGGQNPCAARLPLYRDVVVVSPTAFAITYFIVATAIVPLVFEFFKTKYTFVDVLIASAGAAIVSFVPSPYGGPLSLVANVGLLYWRIRSDLAPDILAAVAAARLAMIPIALSLRYYGIK
jgi:hypothetical protein